MDKNIEYSKLVEMNEAYRQGMPLVSNFVFEEVLAKFEAKFGKVTFLDSPGGEIELKFKASSLNKKKTFSALMDWIGDETELWVSGKFDGISISHEDMVAKTRGENGLLGFDVTRQFRHVGDVVGELTQYSRGEVVISWEKFDKYFAPRGYSHPRNAIAGLFNPRTTEVNASLIAHASYIPYYSADGNEQKISDAYRRISRSELTPENLMDVFKNWDEIYPCDGLVFIKGSTLNVREGNPENSIAYKPKEFDSVGESEVVSVTRQISKYGILSPVINIKPISLGGGLIKNIYVDNEAFVALFGIGYGTKIQLIRSGSIIPRLKAVNGYELPTERTEVTELLEKYAGNYKLGFEEHISKITAGVAEYAYEEHDKPYIWDGLRIRIVDSKEEILIRKIDYFLKTLGCKGVGINTIKTILEVQPMQELRDFLSFDFELLSGTQGFDAKLIQNLKKGCEPMKKTQTYKLMQACSIFEGLGSEKLKLYLSEGEGAKGLGDFARECLRKNMFSWEVFKQHYLSLGFKLIDSGTVTEVWCHTMCRVPKDIIEKLEETGISVVDSYSKKIKKLVVPSFDIESSKFNKAKSDGVEIMLLSDVIKLFTKTQTDESLF